MSARRSSGDVVWKRENAGAVSCEGAMRFFAIIEQHADGEPAR